MPNRGKKYIEANQKVDRLKKYAFKEAVELAIDSSYVKFDASLDVSVRLGVDPRHADQMVRGAVSLPHGIGKPVRVIVFAKGEKEKEATEAGADLVGAEDLSEKIQNGWLEFDKAVATPDMMGIVGKLGRILGPRGMMPNAKLGTVTFDVAKAVTELKAGKIDFKVDKTGIIHASIGRVSFGADKLLKNAAFFLDTIFRLKPPSSKGTYIKSLTISNSMGPGIKIDTTNIRDFVR
ncbi:MAG: 50S ribosomal protein L1 [Thermodesulfobacteriota bacterium]|jgi:large subunit ribosomal protein L1